MKASLLLMIPGILLGWFIAVALHVNEGHPEKKDRQVPERLSLLGNRPIQNDQVPEVNVLDNSSRVSDILARLESATTVDIKSWLLTWATSGEPPKEVMEIVIKYFTSLDPEGAYHFLLSKEEFVSHVPVALSEWAQLDLHAALSAALEAEPNEEWLLGVMESLDVTGCEEVYRALIAHGIDQTNPHLFIELFSRFAEEDPKLASERVLEFSRIHNEIYVHQMMRETFDLWYREDPDEAYQWALDNMSSFMDFADGHISAALKYEGVKGLERVWEQLDDEQREALTGFDYPQEDFDKMVEWIDQNVESTLLYGKMLASVANGLGHSDHPERIVDLISKLDADYDFQHFDFQKISQRWAQLDHEGLQKWIDSVDNPVIRDSAIRGQLTQLASEDPVRGAEMLSEHEDLFSTWDLSQLVYDLLDPRRSEDPKLILDLLPESMRDIGVEKHAMNTAEKAPEETMSFLESQPEGRKRNGMLQLTLGQWARKDPSAAADWVDQLEDGAQKEMAMRNLADTWVRFDAEAAHAWVANQPASANRDIAARYVIESITHHRPQDAFALAVTVTDEESRESLIRNSLGNLARQNPNLAREQAEAAGIYSSWKDLIEGERALNELLEE